jgi:hypothetical protein
MKFIIFLTGLFLSLPASAISITWRHNLAGLRNVDQTTALIGDNSSGNIGYFIQLIYAGNTNVVGDVTPNVINSSSVTGVTGNDAVLAYSHIGRNMGFNPKNGNINATASPTLVQGDVIFARIWNNISPNYASGIIPSSFNGGVATHYGNSATYTVTATDITNNFVDFFIPSTSTIIAIPEPGTLATIAGGLAVVVFGLRRRRYRI